MVRMNVRTIQSGAKSAVTNTDAESIDIASCKNLPTLPHVAMRIMEVALEDDASVRDLAEVVALDPALSARVLRTVNSAFYGFPSEVTTLSHATSILGMRVVRNLSLGLLIVREFSQGANSLDTLASRQLWKRVLSAAVIAKTLGGRLDKRLAEEAFLVSLLQDIGMLALMATVPQKYRMVLAKNLRHGPDLCEAERAIFKTDHAEAGRVLAGKWNLPKVYQDCLGSHHDKLRDVPVETFDENLRRVVQFSAQAACLVTSGNGDPVEAIRLRDIAEKRFSIEGNQLERMLKDAHVYAVELGNSFEVPMSGMHRYTDLLEQAVRKLSEMGISYEQAVARTREETSRLQQSIEELEQANKQLEQLASYDELTKLYNKKSFMEALSRAVKRTNRYKRPLSVMMIDVDNFKRVNDTYGHEAGDAVLKHLAATMLKTIRETDVLARYGGEEFVVLLTETGAGQVEAAAERLRMAVEQTRFPAHKKTLRVTVSVGAASCSPQDNSVLEKTLIEYADKALYQAKRAGRNRSCVARLS